ncbi:hypothetical protein K3165_10670 [Qipengyuania sp. 1XM1-15A]|uniref:hypothetical protein n=1 Tax=Qipengyuania xiamenensis TaxID=2867237 RepID=UPI001C86CACE|nr:hypothetical protein [Qipengyuania xiamenensis]MBX7533387.1 hypothetical protein [Qipengyuania xiamenensis]
MLRIAFAAATLITLAGCSSGTEPDEAAETDAPETETTEAAAPTREDDIRHFLLQEYPEAGTMRYALAWSDLDGDGADEAIVYLAAPYFCGTGGCPTLVLTPAGPMWRKVGDISVSRTPVTVLDSATNGWKDITVAVSGGGGPSGNALLKFDGEAYPSNPTVAPAEMTETTGEVVIAEMPEFIDLDPEVTPEG